MFKNASAEQIRAANLADNDFTVHRGGQVPADALNSIWKSHAKHTSPFTDGIARRRDLLHHES